MKVREKLARHVPEVMKSAYRMAKIWLLGILYRGNSRYCPVCEQSFRKFGDYGIESRTDAICLACGALERHRLTWLFFRNQTDLFDGKSKKMLHVAPEPFFEQKIGKSLGNDYLTADLNDSRAMVRMDISEIPFPDGYFDVIYCSHVLEHVYDDRKAIREFFRVLNEEGWAVLLVPITAKSTLEDVSVLDPRERLKRFGQEDHVRRYGNDFPERLREADFHVHEIGSKDICRAEETEAMGLTEHAGRIFYCTKKRHDCHFPVFAP